MGGVQVTVSWSGGLVTGGGHSVILAGPGGTERKKKKLIIKQLVFHIQCVAVLITKQLPDVHVASWTLALQLRGEDG